MSRRDGIGFFGNVLANLLVGAAGMGYAVLVPAVVIRGFGTDLYGTWYLAFQVAAYVLLLDLGSQYVVATESSSPCPDRQAAQLATAAVVAQSILAVTVVGAATAWAVLTGQARLARLVAILGVAAIASLSASTVRAWYSGLQRAHLPAVWLVSARVLAVVGLAVALAASGDLVTITLAVATPQLAVHAGFLLWARRVPSPWARPDRDAFVRLIRSSSPLALWTVCGVFITGVDIFLVRVVDPSELGRYAIALPLLAIPIAVVTAVTTAWLPRIARLEATSSLGGRASTLTGTTIMAAALSIGAIPFIAYADEIVRLWAGPGRGGSAATYLQLLYLASCLRFAFLPWSILIVVRGEQRRITLAPLTEAGVNLAASVLLGLWLGALGVALGTLAGAFVAAVLYLVWAVPRTAGCGIRSLDLLRAARAAWIPLVTASAVIVVALTEAPPGWRGLATLIAVGIDGCWLLLDRGRMARDASFPPGAVVGW